jgi:hypothetical protein
MSDVRFVLITGSEKRKFPKVAFVPNSGLMSGRRVHLRRLDDQPIG